MLDLHITVAAAPNVQLDSSRMLEQELKLAKASILYADKVKLCSMSAWLVTNFYFLGNPLMNEAQKLEIITAVAPALDAKDLTEVNLSELGKLMKLFKRNPLTLTKKERQRRSLLKSKISEAWEGMITPINEMLEHSGFKEIELAVNYGMLEIQPFSKTDNDMPYEYLAAVEEMLSSPLTHPMFDEVTNNLVRSALEEGKISVRNNSSRRSKQIGLVANLFDRLPVFDVPMAELLDLREELRNPLIRFRAEMVKLGNSIETASWDKDFPSDVQETYQSKVEPALLDIEEQLKSTNFKEFWSRKLVDKASYIAGAGGIIGASVAPWAGLITALTAFGIFTTAGIAELEEKTRDIERNGLYFYYQMKQQVNKS